MIETLEINKTTINQTISSNDLVCDFMDHQHFKCLDRIIIMSGTFTSMSGTVVGVHGELLDVVMDEENAQFNNLNKLCSDKRGLSINKKNCVNCSDPQPFIDAKWGKVEEHVTKYKQDNIRGKSTRGSKRGGAKSTKYNSNQSFSSIVNSEKEIKSKQDDLKAILGIK